MTLRSRRAKARYAIHIASVFAVQFAAMALFVAAFKAAPALISWAGHLTPSTVETVHAPR